MNQIDNFARFAATVRNSATVQANGRDILEKLTSTEPVKLIDLPEKFGVYALWDHTDQVRYIGCTPKATKGFHTRIYKKHATGSVGYSHKFSQAYCTGRMWGYCEKLHPADAGIGEVATDARAAKTLRTAFVRAYCKASYVPIDPNSLQALYSATLTALEAQVHSMAHKAMRAWEGIRFAPLPTYQLTL